MYKPPYFVLRIQGQPKKGVALENGKATDVLKVNISAPEC
jgi:hypothetical protein